MIGVDEARRIASAKLGSKLAQWATQPADAPVLSVPLGPPSEREVRADELAAETWVREWSEATLPSGVELVTGDACARGLSSCVKRSAPPTPSTP